MSNPSSIIKVGSYDAFISGSYTEFMHEIRFLIEKLESFGNKVRSPFFEEDRNSVQLINECPIFIFFIGGHYATLRFPDVFNMTGKEIISAPEAEFLYAMSLKNKHIIVFHKETDYCEKEQKELNQLVYRRVPHIYKYSAYGEFTKLFEDIITSNDLKQTASSIRGTCFISHSNEDSDFVYGLSKALDNSNIPIWIDRRELHAGDDLDTKIQNAIENTAILIAIISRSSVNSEWVEKEVGWARDVEKKYNEHIIMPLLLDDEECVSTNSAIYDVVKNRLRIDFAGKSNNSISYDGVIDAVQKFYTTNIWHKR